MSIFTLYKYEAFFFIKDGKGLLHHACQFGQLPVAHYLLDNNCDLDAEDEVRFISYGQLNNRMITYVGSPVGLLFTGQARMAERKLSLF